MVFSEKPPNEGYAHPWINLWINPQVERETQASRAPRTELTNWGPVSAAILAGPMVNNTAGIRVSRNTGNLIPATAGLIPGSSTSRSTIASARVRPPNDSKDGTR